MGRLEEALNMDRDIYYGHVKLNGADHHRTLGAAYNYAAALKRLDRFEEARSIMRKTMPVARRVLGESHELTLKMRSIYAQALCLDTSATLDDLREAVTTLEDVERIVRRTFGGTHPFAALIEQYLHTARAALCLRTH